jgi:hypothetical protein
MELRALKYGEMVVRKNRLAFKNELY